MTIFFPDFCDLKKSQTKLKTLMFISVSLSIKKLEFVILKSLQWSQFKRNVPIWCIHVNAKPFLGILNLFRISRRYCKSLT